MRPKRIILIRHGESEGNVDPILYTQKPDYAIELSPEGKKQSFEAGKKLRALLGNESLRVYQSSFFRARRTTSNILKSFSDNNLEYTLREDLRLMEQGYGNLMSHEDQKKMLKERDEYSHFYYRGGSAENGVDLYVRVSSFLDTLHRDFKNPNFEDNCVIVSHGLTIRMFIARWLHYTVEEYETIKNPNNCQMITLQLNNQTQKYELTEPLEQHTVYHQWRYVPDED